MPARTSCQLATMPSCLLASSTSRTSVTYAYRRKRWTFGPPRGVRALRDVAELLGLRDGLQLLERLVLDLADALARHVERAAHLVQRAGVLPAEAVAELQDA